MEPRRKLSLTPWLALVTLCLLPIGRADAQGWGLTESAWPRFGRDAGATGLAESIGPETPDIRWRVPLGGDSGSPAIGEDGVIYIGDDAGVFRALSPEGEGLWSLELPGGFGGFAPAVGADGTIYVGVTGAGRRGKPGLYALTAEGARKWSFATQADVSSSPNIGSDGAVYVAAAPKLYALDETGKPKWTYEIGAGVPVSSPAVDEDGDVYAAGSGLHCIRPDGKLAWTYLGHGGEVAGAAAHPAVGPDGTVYLADSRLLCAIEPAWGYELWVAEVGKAETSPVVGPDGTVYVATCGDGKNLPPGLMAFSPEDGALKWTFTVEVGAHSSPAVDAEGNVYFGTDDGYLVALKPDGAVRWMLDVGAGTDPARVRTSPAIGSDGTLYFGHAGGRGDAEGLAFFAVGGARASSPPGHP